MRVHIYGPLEARLQSVDRLVLGGLVEGVWPPQTRGDPWLSRPMRHSSASTCRSGASGCRRTTSRRRSARREVILARAAKLGGAPTVASRFVQRLAAVAGETRWNAALDRGARYAAVARKLDDAGAAKTVPAPSHGRRSRHGRASSASPRSSIGSAIPTRSTPSTC